MTINEVKSLTPCGDYYDFMELLEGSSIINEIGDYYLAIRRSKYEDSLYIMRVKNGAVEYKHILGLEMLENMFKVSKPWYDTMIEIYSENSNVKEILTDECFNDFDHFVKKIMVHVLCTIINPDNKKDVLEILGIRY